MKHILVLFMIVASVADALVTCNCPRFSTTDAIFTTCLTALGSDSIGGQNVIVPGDGGSSVSVNWTATTDLHSIDLCGDAQNKSHQPEILHGFNILAGKEGFYRIETYALSEVAVGIPNVHDHYTVVLQLETGSEFGYYPSAGAPFVDESHRKCNIGQTKDGNSYQAQVTENLDARYYVLKIEATPDSVDKPNVAWRITRVEQTQSPSISPTPPTRSPTTGTPTIDASHTTAPSKSPTIKGLNQGLTSVSSTLLISEYIIVLVMCIGMNYLI
jgi:hypothetical protein